MSDRIHSQLLTVLVITYNHSPFIKRALESVLEQRTTFGYCVHVLDDASTDGTSDIVRAYGVAHPGIVIPYIRASNGGVANVREGLARIQTKYYATLEGDDCWCDVNKLQIQVDLLEANPDCTMCGHNTLCKYLAPVLEKSPHPFLRAKTQKVKGIPKSFWGKKVVVPHLSSRVYVTAYQSRGRLKNLDVLVWGLSSYYWFLSQGNCYYLDRIMSVYHSGAGLFSAAPERYQRQLGLRMVMMVDQALDSRYTPYLMRKAANLLRLPWFKKWCFCCWWTQRTRDAICHAFLDENGQG